MNTNPTPTYLLVQDRLGTNLDQHIAARRAEGESWTSIAYEIRDITGMSVTGETLRSWHAATTAA